MMFTLNNLKKCIYNSQRFISISIYIFTLYIYLFWEIFAKHFIKIEIGEDRN